jgi:uncharacterized protein (DUF58 family)
MPGPGRLLYLNFRFLHRLSQWVRRRFSPAGLLIIGGIIASGIFGIDTRQSLAFQVFAITSSLLMLSIVSSLVFRGNFHFQRRLPEYGTVTLPLRYKLIVANRDPAQHRDLVLMDELASEFPDYETFKKAEDPLDKQRNWVDRKIGYPRLVSLIRTGRGGVLPMIDVDLIPGRDETEIDLEFVPLRRGYLHFAGTSISRPDPFGLFRAIKHSDNPARLLILPKTYQVPQITLSGNRKYQPGGINQASAVGDSQEFLSLRDYQPGDPMRSIHWRSYAKRGEPVVKEFRDEYFVRQGLILDTFIESHSSAKFEEAVSLAASFAMSIEDQDSLLDLMFVGTTSYRFTTGRSFGKAANMLEILACVNPCHDHKLDALADLTLRHLNELSGLVVILLGWDQKRQDMIARFISFNLPVLVFVITDAADATELALGPMMSAPQRLIPLPAGAVQAGLDRINWNTI